MMQPHQSVHEQSRDDIPDADEADAEDANDEEADEEEEDDETIALEEVDPLFDKVPSSSCPMPKLCPSIWVTVADTKCGS